MEASDNFSDRCLTNGCDYNILVGQYFLGLAFYKGLCGPVNYKEAAKCFSKAAEQREEIVSDFGQLPKKCSNYSEPPHFSKVITIFNLNLT